MLTVDFNKLNLKDEDTLLDLGCGEGRHAISAALLDIKLKVIAIDLNYGDLETAQGRFQEFRGSEEIQCLFGQADGLKLPFADNIFDHIVCSEVLEHIPDYESMLREIYRVLKPGGSLCVSVPRYWPERICWLLSTAYHQVEGGHIRIFKSKLLKKEITNLRFFATTKHWAHALHSPYWWIRCAFWDRGENFFLARWYHRLLVWDLLHKPFITQFLEKALNPLLGKSVVLYFSKPNQ